MLCRRRITIPTPVRVQRRHFGFGGEGYAPTPPEASVRISPGSRINVQQSKPLFLSIDNNEIINIQDINNVSLRGNFVVFGVRNIGHRVRFETNNEAETKFKELSKYINIIEWKM